MPQLKARNAREFASDIQTALRLTDDERLGKYGMAMHTLRVVWASRRKLQDENAQLRRAAQSWLSVVERQCRDVLDATGMHDIIDESGDGDWALVWERIATMGADLRAAQARVRELEAFVGDIACHGLRCDLNPTMDHSTPEKHAEGMLRYLRSVDASMRREARRLVPEAVTPYSPGRPRPAAKIEVVAESGVTELDLLRAQDGDR